MYVQQNFEFCTGVLRRPRSSAGSFVHILVVFLGKRVLVTPNEHQSVKGRSCVYKELVMLVFYHHDFILCSGYMYDRMVCKFTIFSTTTPSIIYIQSVCKYVNICFVLFCKQPIKQVNVT